jgi:hypothetical protein
MRKRPVLHNYKTRMPPLRYAYNLQDLCHAEFQKSELYYSAEQLDMAVDMNRKRIRYSDEG